MLMNFAALGGLWVSHRLLVVKSVPRHGRLQAIFCLILLHNSSTSLTFIGVLFPLDFWLISRQLCLFVISTTTHQMIWSKSGTDLLFMWCMKCKRNERRGRVYLFVLLPNLLIVFSQTYIFVGLTEKLCGDFYLYSCPCIKTTSTI